MNVSNCRGQTDQAPGDCANQEWRIQPWFSYNWDCILRHPDTEVQHLISDYARHGADNECCGYSQSNRLSFWYELQQVGYDPKNITTPCDADCSSSTGAIVKAVGYTLGKTALQNVSENVTTFWMESDFVQAGFEALRGSILYSDAELIPGDVVLNSQCHVCIAVADHDYGSNGVTNSDTLEGVTETVTPTETVNETVTVASKDTIVYQPTQLPILRQDWLTGNPRPDVRAAQTLLNMHGSELNVDGVYGDETVNAVKLYQAQSKIDTDGQIGPQTWKKLIEGE